MENREPRVGDSVNVISGPHEGRSGTISTLRQVQKEWGDPEWYALLDYQETDCYGDVHKDQIAVPTRRLRPR
jgi:hypothetical protein